MSGYEHPKISGSREIIKNQSSEKSHSIGYFMNLIADLGIRHKITKGPCPGNAGRL